MLILIAKALIFLLGLRGGGSSYPGKFLLKFNSQILRKLARGWHVILVTGTNGKTTTSHMIYQALLKANYIAINNEAGANMTPGIVACFAKHYRFFDKRQNRYAVIEVDEAYMRQVTTFIEPKFIVVTNIFRDQLDRYGETTTTYQYILDSIVNTPHSTLILNGDESMLGNMPIPNDCIYYGFDNYGKPEIATNTESIFCRDCKTRYEYESIVFNHLGHYYCTNCEHKRPKLNYAITDVQIKANMSHFAINHDSIEIAVPGLYNIYNATAAYTVAAQLGIDQENIKASLLENESKFGRFENIQINHIELTLLLIKNPAGCNQCIDTVSIDENEISLMFLLNDQYADGRDVSWIYDAHFEKLSNMKVSKIIIGGDRAYDMAIRLKVAGLDKNNFTICHQYDDLIEAVEHQEKKIYAFTTYTAMTSFRSYLVDKGFARKL